VQGYVGKRLGPYQLVEQIGRGGMATIYKAYQASMDRYVAVKVLPSHFTEDETFVARFTQEARTLARLEHPHILPVYDYGEQEGITYLVMRFIDAGTLKDLITRQGALDLRDIARILSQVGRALDYAHSEGVVHRDIKPTNVLIDERGDAFLTDFGIAKLVAGTAQFTATGAVIGTPAYMSPEQGMAEEVDHRSDIYSLGVVLYEMATGQVPFEAETPLAVLLKHVNAPLPMPRHVRSSLPEAVERVILKAMAKSPEDRFPTARAMVNALQAAVAGTEQETVAAPPIETQAALPPAKIAKRPPPRRTKRSWLPLAGGLAAVGVVAVVALLVLFNSGGGGGDATPVGGLVAGSTSQPANTTAIVSPTGAESSPTVPPAPSSTPPPPTATPVPLPTYAPGWTSYSNTNSVEALALQNGYLWAGGEGGLVRWDLQDGSYREYGIADGLSGGRVNDLMVDRGGILWVATDRGISRFNGKSWLNFGLEDGLDALWVETLFQDSEDGVWAATAYGERSLNYFDGRRWGAPPVPPLPIPFPNPQVLLEDDEGDLVVGLEMSGLAYYDGSEWTTLTTADGLPSDQVRDILITDNALWVSGDYQVARFDLDTGEPEIVPELDGMAVYHIFQDSEDAIWFAGEGGIRRYDPNTDRWDYFDAGSSEIPAWAVTDIVESDAGLWFGTYGAGVLFYDGDQWEVWAADNQIGGSYTSAIVQDGSGAVWFVHDGSGLSRYQPAQDSWETFGEAEGALAWPSRPGVDPDGQLWIGGYGELLRYDGEGWRVYGPTELGDSTIFAVAFDPQGTQWLLTDGGVVRHDPLTEEWTTFTVDDNPVLADLSAFLVADDGTVWGGSSEGLVHYDGVNWAAPALSNNPSEWISDIAQAPDGSIWVVAGGSLYHMEEDRWVRFDWPGDGWTEWVAVGPDGVVWTGYEGLARLDPTNGSWTIFGTEDGLIHPEVYTIYVTPDGVVWVGTAGGISRYVPGD
jgi:serine/threonine protein kinase/ligand-binding sensor domain-containing protein